MNRFLFGRGLLAFFLCFLAAAGIDETRAWFANGGQLQGFNASAGGSPPTVQFPECAGDASNATTYTFSSANVGTASANRFTIVWVRRGHRHFGVRRKFDNDWRR